ncbi:MAG: hypothetical protein M1825_006049 [Sarcosagium campestre]|nr:MAG: hypothetical protein M1825_006049 [Sarcosagium campestre]
MAADAAALHPPQTPSHRFSFPRAIPYLPSSFSEYLSRGSDDTQGPSKNAENFPDSDAAEREHRPGSVVIDESENESCRDVPTDTDVSITRAAKGLPSSPTARSVRSKKSTRLKTSFRLAHPPPPIFHHRRLQRRPRLLLQLHRVSQSARREPPLDVVPSALLAPRLARGFPRFLKGRDGPSVDDLVVLINRGYNAPKLIEEGGNDVSDDDSSDSRDVVATICQARVDQDLGSSGKAELCFKEGPLWEATPLSTGAYEISGTDRDGQRILARWVPRPSARRRSQGLPKPRVPSIGVDEDRKFSFSIIDPNKRRHPVIAVMTGVSIDVFDTYPTVAPMGDAVTASPVSDRSTYFAPSHDDTSLTPEESMEIAVDDQLRTLIVPSNTATDFVNLCWPNRIASKSSVGRHNYLSTYQLTRRHAVSRWQFDVRTICNLVGFEFEYFCIAQPFFLSKHADYEKEGIDQDHGGVMPIRGEDKDIVNHLNFETVKGRVSLPARTSPSARPPSISSRDSKSLEHITTSHSSSPINGATYFQVDQMSYDMFTGLSGVDDGHLQTAGDQAHLPQLPSLSMQGRMDWREDAGGHILSADRHHGTRFQAPSYSNLSQSVPHNDSIHGNIGALVEDDISPTHQERFSGSDKSRQKVSSFSMDGACSPAKHTTSLPGLSMNNKQPSKIRSTEEPKTPQKQPQGKKTSKDAPELSHLKAKALASMRKGSRVTNAGLPSKDTALGKADRNGIIEKDVARPDSQTPRRLQLAPMARKDSRTDIDGLLAEGKAAAEAGHTRRTNDTRTESISPVTGQKDVSKAKESAITHTQTHKTENGQISSTNGRVSRISSGSSELGEIRDEAIGSAAVLPDKAKEEDLRKPVERPHLGSTVQQDAQHAGVDAPKNARTTKQIEEPNGRSTAGQSDCNIDKDKNRKENIPPEKSHVLESDPGRPLRDSSFHPQDSRSPANPTSRPNGNGQLHQRVLSQKRAVAQPERISPQYEEAGSRRSDEIQGDDDPLSVTQKSQLLPLAASTNALVRKEPEHTILADSYWSDLDDWLDMTGYHDHDYRVKSLGLYREISALEVRKASLEQEAKAALEERNQQVRSQPVLLRAPEDKMLLRTPNIPRALGPASASAMPPPPFALPKDTHRVPLTRDGQDSSSDSIHTERDRASTALVAEKNSATRSRQASPPTIPERSGVKRRYVEDIERIDAQHLGKSARLDDRVGGFPHNDDVPNLAVSKTERNDYHRASYAEPVRDRRSSKEYYREDATDLDSGRRESQTYRRPVSPTRYGTRDWRIPSPLDPRDRMALEGRPPPHQIEDKGRMYPNEHSPRSRVDYGGRPRLDPRDTPFEDVVEPTSRRRYSDDWPRRSSQHHADDDRVSHSTRGRGRGRGGHPGAEVDRPISSRSPKRGRQDADRPLDLINSVTRYFVIKSFNADNVEQAQNEEVWVTQAKNSDMFKDAFETCDNVILIFSINKSTAFQGYARMESAPGTAQIPRWASVLHWEFSGPFRIRWITIAETKFHLVGHLKNPYNGGMPVLVARDGQEIEPKIGAALCELIDDVNHL